MWVSRQEEIRSKINELGDLKDQPVTWESLMEIMAQTGESITKSLNDGDERTYRVIDSVRDSMVKLYDESEYRRMRSMVFVLAMIGHTDYNTWRPIYDKFCEDYDKLNRKD